MIYFVSLNFLFNVTKTISNWTDDLIQIWALVCTDGVCSSNSGPRLRKESDTFTCKTKIILSNVYTKYFNNIDLVLFRKLASFPPLIVSPTKSLSDVGYLLPFRIIFTFQQSQQWYLYTNVLVVDIFERTVLKNHSQSLIKLV